MGFSFWHIALVAVLIFVLFGRGRIPQMMGDLAQGIKSFKQGMRDEPAEPQNLSQNESAPQRSE